MSESSSIENVAPEQSLDATPDESVQNKKKWLENAFSDGKNENKEPNPTSQPQISNELTSDRVKWLREQAFNKSSKQNDNDGEAEAVPVSNELAKDRVRWLEEQAFKQKQTSKDLDEDSIDAANVSHELTSDRVRWLQEQAFQKRSTKSEDDGNDESTPVSNELTTDKVRWLQEQAFHKKKSDNVEGEDEAEYVSNELTTDRVRWLQEQAFQKNQSETDGAEEEVPASKELTSDKVRWLQEQAFHKEEKEMDGESVPVSNELTTGKVKTFEKQTLQNTQHNEASSSKKSALDENSYYDDNDSYSDEGSFVHSDYGSNDEDSISDENEEDEMPDGNDNDDLYALLAYSKGRVKDRKIEDSNENKSQLENENTSCEDVDDEKEESNDQDDEENDLLEEDDCSYDSLGGHEDDTNDDHDETPIVDEMSDDGEKKLQVEAGGSQIKNKQKQETDELWALLNYSKVRLATGATPTADEAKALGIKGGNDVLAQDEGDNDESHRNDDEEDANSIASDSDLNDSIMSDDSALSNDGSSVNTTEILKQEDLAATRARALAALERTKHVFGDNDKAEISEQQKDLSEKQILKSMVLAEEASQSGAVKFTTQEKLSVLDKVPTPKKGPRGKVRFGRGRGGNVERDINVEISGFRQRARNFFSETKKKAEKALDSMKETVEKIEKHNTKGQYYDASTPGITVRKDSPFKNFSNNILKVEKMNEQKYGGDEILYV